MCRFFFLLFSATLVLVWTQKIYDNLLLVHGCDQLEKVTVNDIPWLFKHLQRGHEQLANPYRSIVVLLLLLKPPAFINFVLNFHLGDVDI